MELNFENVSVNNALKDINLNIKSGSKLTIMGDKNSDLSIFHYLIGGLVKPQKGKVQIGEFTNDGGIIKNINKLRFSVGVVSKYKSDMFFNKYVKDELAFALKYFKYKIKEKDMRVENVIKIVGLQEEYLTKKIDDLTNADSVFVSLASVLVYNPEIIILDEPSRYLNTFEKTKLIKVLDVLNKKYNKTIILLTKDSDFAYQFTSNVAIIHNQLLVENSANSILENSETLKKYNIRVPKIVEMIDTINKERGRNIKYYKDIKDLIKGVCNDVL